jgi:hypothetical protein
MEWQQYTCVIGLAALRWLPFDFVEVAAFTCFAALGDYETTK